LALEEAFARAGRNDLCPCGSGQKFKRCHGQRENGQKDVNEKGRTRKVQPQFSSVVQL
jgi:uncharacterized protein